MESQLTAILNFYAYLIIAMDSDTFESRGGQALYDQLQQIVQWAQSSGETGWKAFEDTKNRSAVLAALTDQKPLASETYFMHTIVVVWTKWQRLRTKAEPILPHLWIIYKRLSM